MVPTYKVVLVVQRLARVDPRETSQFKTIQTTILSAQHLVSFQRQPQSLQCCCTPVRSIALVASLIESEALVGRVYLRKHTRASIQVTHSRSFHFRQNSAREHGVTRKRHMRKIKSTRVTVENHD